MTNSELFLKPLPLGSASFETIRAAAEVYVDKTALVAQLAACRRKLFMARPQRFGKSLLLSTFKSLFQNGLDHFRGLAIESLWQDKKTYPVVHLSFSRLKRFESETSFQREVESRIAQAYRALGFVYDPTSFIRFFDQLEGWLLRQPPMAYVFLIDDYDAPLTAHLDDAVVLQKIRRVLASFYAVIKTTEGRSVFNPSSVVRFLERPAAGFENYWRQSGGLASGLFKYFQASGRCRSWALDQGRWLSRAVLEASASEDGLSEEALMTQAGCLTIKRRQFDDYFVECPNDEAASVVRAMARIGG